MLCLNARTNRTEDNIYYSDTKEIWAHSRSGWIP